MTYEVADKMILCPDCGHSINAHEFEFDFEQYFCGGTYGDCECHLSPSGVARALLVAEPTDAEVDAAAEAVLDVLMDDGHNGPECRIERPLDYTAAAAARAALKAWCGRKDW